MRWLLGGVIWLLVAGQLVGQSLQLPDDIKTGASFVWFLTSIHDPHEVGKFKDADIVINRRNEKKLEELVSLLHSERGSFRRSVAFIHQIPISIDLGDQEVIYRLYSEHEGTVFVKVHILGDSTPAKIVSAELMKSDDVVDLVARRKIIDIPQE